MSNQLQQGFEQAVEAYPDRHIAGYRTVWLEGLFDDEGEAVEVPHTFQLVDAIAASFHTSEREGMLVLQEQRPGCRDPFNHWGFMVAKSELKVRQE